MVYKNDVTLTFVKSLNFFVKSLNQVEICLNLFKVKRLVHREFKQFNYLWDIFSVKIRIKLLSLVSCISVKYFYINFENTFYSYLLIYQFQIMWWFQVFKSFNYPTTFNKEPMFLGWQGIKYSQYIICFISNGLQATIF